MPPNTVTPLTLRIEMSASGAPIHTAVDRVGVYPTNQALVLLSVDPVLPAACPSRHAGARPVPRATTWVRTWLTSLAFCEEMARSPVGAASKISLPSMSSTLSMT